MQLVTSLTIDASLLRKLLRLWDEAGDPRNPFAKVLVTPLFASPSTLRFIREELKEKRGSLVYFDSGGYYVQQGKLSFSDLYCRLRDYYHDPNNQWADWYVLPDHVPTSVDSSEVVERKVNDTVTAAKMFFAEMPTAIQERSISVVQGHTFDQVNLCIEAYRSLGQKYLGFGSFGTSGSNNSINIADSRAASNVSYLVRELKSDDVRLHTFGISTPPVIYAFQRLGIFSFDSMAWLRSAGYGKAFLPFVRAYNISHRSTRNSALSEIEFEQIKQQTGHQCPFCRDFGRLSKSRLLRALHNLLAVIDTVNPRTRLSDQQISDLIAWKSSRYHRMFSEVYLD